MSKRKGLSETTEEFLSTVRKMAQQGLDGDSIAQKKALLMKLEEDLDVAIHQLSREEQACVSALAQLVLLEDLYLRGERF